MNDELYHRLAKVLDTLPNGFPATESGIEIKLLKKIFRPEDAALFCELRLDFETTQQISERTGRALEGLEEHLAEMRKRGQIFGVDLGGIMMFKMGSITSLLMDLLDYVNKKNKKVKKALDIAFDNLYRTINFPYGYRRSYAINIFRKVLRQDCYKRATTRNN